MTTTETHTLSDSTASLRSAQNGSAELRANVRFLLNVCGVKAKCEHCGAEIYKLRKASSTEIRPEYHPFDPTGISHYPNCKRKPDGR